MKRLLSINVVDGGFMFQAPGTHGIKAAYAPTIAAAVAIASKVHAGTEGPTPPVILETPAIHVWEAGVGFVITAERAGGLGFEIVAFLPPDFKEAQITEALERCIAGEQVEIEHAHRHRHQEAEVKQFPRRLEDIEDGDDPKKVN